MVERDRKILEDLRAGFTQAATAVRNGCSQTWVCRVARKHQQETGERVEKRPWDMDMGKLKEFDLSAKKWATCGTCYLRGEHQCLPDLTEMDVCR